MMVFLTAFRGVPKELEEAALANGTNRRQCFEVVTAPAIWPATVPIIVMLVVGGLSVLTSALLMAKGGPNGQIEILLAYVYRLAFPGLNFRYDSAIVVVPTILVFIISVIQFKVSNRDDGRAGVWIRHVKRYTPPERRCTSSS